MNVLTLPDVASKASRQALPMDQRLGRLESLSNQHLRQADKRSVPRGTKFYVSYSSTCPCSAALARQLIQKQFVEDFPGAHVESAAILEWLGTTEGIVATPHSQRSTAEIHMQLNEFAKEFPTLQLIGL
jgi:GTP cyclohydrolase FolE2